MTFIRCTFLAASVSALALTGCVGLDSSTTSSDLNTRSGKGAPEPPMLGIHYAKGHGGGGGGGSSPLLNYGGGSIMTNVVVQPIFWGTSWAGYTGDKITGLEGLYDVIPGGTYAITNTEYTDSSGSHVTSTAMTRDPSIVDTSAAPNHAPQTSAILAEVCSHITNPSPNGYYPVYTDTPRGHASYCAWHSWGTCNGVNVQFGFFFNLDNDSGCDVTDGAGRSIPLASLANVTGHELSEMVTDPRGTGWTDSSGSENADKCAWVFDQPAVMADGSTWTIQGNWSNAAYTAGTGFANSSGQAGCLYNN